MTGGQEPPLPLAPLGRRAAAWAIDLAIVLAASLVYTLLVSGGAAASLLAVALALGGVAPELEGAFRLGIAVTVATIVGGMVALHALYWVLFTGLQGQTPGKMLLGIRVVDARGNRPGIARAFMREIVGKFLSKLVCYLGYLWVFVDRHRQAWHDKIADTYVVADSGLTGHTAEGC